MYCTNTMKIKMNNNIKAIKAMDIIKNLIMENNEYSCAVTPQIRQTGNRLSGNAGTAYASLLA